MAFKIKRVSVKLGDRYTLSQAQYKAHIKAINLVAKYHNKGWYARIVSHCSETIAYAYYVEHYC